jgi:hypothetical protein
MNERRFDACASDAVVNIADRMPVRLSPCPFCEGPPVPIVQKQFDGGGYAEPRDEYGYGGWDVRAFVFCHECGSDGPDVTGTIYDRADYAAIERQAVGLWQRRDNRHRSLFDGGQAEGLNLYPRADNTALRTHAGTDAGKGE